MGNILVFLGYSAMEDTNSFDNTVFMNE